VVLRPVAERMKKRDAALARARTVAEHAHDLEGRVRAEVEAAGPRGLSPQQIAARAGSTLDRAQLERIGLVSITRDRWVSNSVVGALAARVLQALSTEHGQHPASRGLTRVAFQSMGDEALVDATLARLVAEKKISREGEVFARAGWKPKDPDAVAHLAPVRAAILAGGVTPPRVEEIAQSLNVDPKALAPALERLVARGDIVKISPEFYADAAAIADLERRLIAWLETHGTIDAQGFKTLTGASRKWTIPLAEFFDQKKVTLRVGDTRKLRAR
jgi:selenocysteine-specific elongation factor